MKIADFFYTSGQTAELLGVTRITILRWIKANKFNVQYIGREALIPKWEFDLLKSIKQKNGECNAEFRN